MLLPNIHPDTPFAEAMATLKEQLPIIDRKAEALKKARNRSLAIRTNIGRSAALLVATGLVGWAASSCYAVNFSPIAYRTWEATRTIGILQPSRTSIKNWMVHLPQDPTIFAPKDPDARPRVLTDGDIIIVNNNNTGIDISDAKLHDGQVVTELRVAYNRQ